MRSTDLHIDASTAARPTLPREVIEQLMPQVVEFAPSGVALTMVDGRILLVNAELERMFGYSRAELLDRPIETLFPKRFQSGHALFRDDNADDFKPCAMGAGRELIGVRMNGSEFPVEVGINALQTPNGVLIVETVVDITMRKRLERIFQEIVEAAPCGMIIVEPKGRIVLVNPQTEIMFGYSRTELIGHSLEMLLPERFRADHVAHREGFSGAPSIRHLGANRDLIARRKDGTEFAVEIGLNPVLGEDDGLVLAVVNDVTRRNTMQLSLRQANSNLEEFTYAASHDLKSPLRGIADLMEWISEDLGADAPAAVTRNLGRVSDRIRRLDRVIDDLLAYAHAGIAHTEAVGIDPRALIAEVVEIIPHAAALRISVQIDAKPFITNKAPLESVLRNLIDNAVKHHDRPAGHIVVRAEDVGRYCVFTISDDGPGIPPAAQERVFRIFQTLAPGTPGTQQHSGIGLALSKRLVEAHGGWLKLESMSGMRGTAFHVWWPRFQWRKTHD